MKRIILSLALIALVLTKSLYAQINLQQPEKKSLTSVGLVIYSNDTETVWNALRLANYSKSEGDTVSIFLLGRGVELDDLAKTDNNIKEQTSTFLDSGGTILGCGTCLHSRKNDEPQLCKLSSLKDLYELIRNNKVVLTF